MITLVAFLLVAATVPVFGGRLSRLARVRPARGWAIAASVLVQVAIFSSLGADLPTGVSVVLHFASYALALIFVHANWRIPGMVLLVSGGLLNLVAIAANGGVMPASYDALVTAGMLPEGEEFRNSNVVDDARLAVLGDIFALREGIPFANVFSIGDVVLVVGGGVLVHTAAGSKLRQAKTHLRLHPGRYRAVRSLLSFLGETSSEVPTPMYVELVDEPRVTVAGSSRKPVLVLGIPILSMVTIEELRALAMRAAIRRSFGASEAFDLGDKHELEASETAARLTSVEDLSFGLMVQASMRNGMPSPDAVLESLNAPVDASGPTLREHLEAIGCCAPRSTEGIAETFEGRVGGRSAALTLFTDSPIVSAPTRPEQSAVDRIGNRR